MSFSRQGFFGFWIQVSVFVSKNNENALRFISLYIQQQRLFLFSTFYGCPRDGPIYFSLSVKPFPISFLLLYTLTACVSVVPLIYVVCMLRYIFMCNVQCTVYCTPTGSPVHYVYV